MESHTLKKTETPMRDSKPPWFTFKTVQDFSFKRPCDQEMMLFNDVFSDFSLSDVGYDEEMKKRIRQWIANEGRSSVITQA